MPRLFTGIVLPAEQRERLSILCSGLAGARWIEPSDFHITLRFIGDVDNLQASEIAGALTKISHSPLILHFDGLDVFGGKKPRSLFARVRGDMRLVALQQKHERLMQDLGLEAEGRKFTPHVTLARFKRQGVAGLAAYLAANGGIALTPFPVEEFALFSARQSIGGGPYVIERLYQLRNSAS